MGKFLPIKVKPKKQSKCLTKSWLLHFVNGCNIACKSFAQEANGKYPNIKIKKILQMLLDCCEFGRDNYNLNIINPPSYEEDD